MQVDLAVFAHNEEQGIAAFLEGLGQQSLIADASVDLRVVLLANGCRDATVARAEAMAAPWLEIQDWSDPGKSRTWHRFVHREARPDAAFLILCDADITFPGPDVLRDLVRAMIDHPARVAMSSRPVKDLTLDPTGAGPIARLIQRATQDSDDWRFAICGQLYIAQTAALRAVPMPTGLPVEDGYLRAMLGTQCFTDMETPVEVEGDPALYHVYESERSLGGLLRHQVRIVIGGSINNVIFDHVTSFPVAERHAVLAAAADDPDWLARLLREALPRWPWGFVPFHFLLKRTQAARPLRLRTLPKVLLGLGFDTVVYIWAQWRMARGVGSGFW